MKLCSRFGLGASLVLSSLLSLSQTSQVKPEYCSYLTSGGGFEKFDSFPGIIAWIAVENNRPIAEALWKSPPDELRKDFKTLEKRIKTASQNANWNNNTAEREKLRDLKSDLVLRFSMLRRRDLAKDEDIDDTLSIVASEPSVIACLQSTVTIHNAAPRLVDTAFKAAGTRFTPVQDNGLVLGLLEAQPLKDEEEVEPGQRLTIERRFVPLTNLPIASSEYGIEMVLQPNNLSPDFLAITPLQKQSFQTIIQNGQASQVRWGFEMSPGEKFKPTTVTLAAYLYKAEYDAKGQRYWSSALTEVSVPFNRVSLKRSPSPSLIDHLKKLKDVGESLFGKVGIFPVLYIGWRRARKLWIRRGKGTPPPPTPATTPAERGEGAVVTG